VSISNLRVVSTMCCVVRNSFIENVRW